MTAEAGSTPEQVDEQVTGEVPGTGPKELREAYDRMKRENAALRGQVMGTHLSNIGLDPEVGLGKAIAKEYSGELTVEALAEYARTEYGHEGTVQAAPPDVAAAQRVDSVMAVGEPVPRPPSPDEAHIARLREAAEAGDTKAAITLKLAQQQ